MDASEALNLYDTYWFGMEILRNGSTASPPSGSDSPPESPTMASMYMQIQKQQASQSPPPEISNLRSRHPTILRSMSEDLYTKPSFSNTPASPDSVLTSQLRTILNGKESTGDELEMFTNYSSPPLPPPRRRVSPTASGSNSPPKGRKAGDGRRRAAKTGPASKSLSSLEFEEVKGFMDLGFVFSDEDKDSRLASILPGLQRLGKKDGEVEPPASATPRPYLSEAWAVQEKEKMRKPAMNWRVPALGLGSEIDMKDSLRLWAHSVASTVR